MTTLRHVVRRIATRRENGFHWLSLATVLARLSRYRDLQEEPWNVQTPINRAVAKIVSPAAATTTKAMSARIRAALAKKRTSATSRGATPIAIHPRSTP